MEDILIVAPKRGDIVKLYLGSRDDWVIGKVHDFDSNAKTLDLILASCTFQRFNLHRFDSIEILSTPVALFNLLANPRSNDTIPPIIEELRNIVEGLRRTRSFAKSKTIKSLRERLEKIVKELS